MRKKLAVVCLVIVITTFVLLVGSSFAGGGGAGSTATRHVFAGNLTLTEKLTRPEYVGPIILDLIDLITTILAPSHVILMPHSIFPQLMFGTGTPI